jgi:glycerophosphoryl diester phosphodiesterase
MPMLDRSEFLRPIAHRGLHDAARGIVENTAPAFAAAVAKGVGIECDLRPAIGGWPIVFHDLTLDRLVAGTGDVASLGPHDLARLRYRGAPLTGILSFAELLELVGGRVPLLVELKSEWTPPDRDFLTLVTSLAKSYRGPLALMSFDPVVMATVAALAPAIPRGIVAGNYRRGDAEGWWDDVLSPERQERLSHLLESRPAKPDFYAYHVAALPTPVTRYVREVEGRPLFTWTVRTAADWKVSAAWADAAIFEGEVCS